MSRAATLSIFGWLIRDTFRQAKASGLFWLLLGITGLFFLVCLSVSVDGSSLTRDPHDSTEFLPRQDQVTDPAKAARDNVPTIQGDLRIGFGVMRIPFGRDAEDAVRFLQLLLAAGVADTAGILLALVWTAGFLPRFLDPATAAVLLAKPAPRWALILGKYAGVVVFVAFQALIFVTVTWLALGIRTEVWDQAYFRTVPLMLIHFGVFYSVSVFLAVATRSTAACIFGSVSFWFLCWGMNYGRHALVAMPEQGAFSGPLRTVVEVGYWLLPKPADFGIILFDNLHAGSFFARLSEFQIVQAKGAVTPSLSILSSLAFAVVVLLMAVYELNQRDF